MSARHRKALAELIAGYLAFMAVWSIGWFVFGIQLSLAQALLVVIALGVSEAVGRRWSR